jgi:NAD(P)-dependent dehydrogenase (short-subunit alcohol dehydrogenase family)
MQRLKGKVIVVAGAGGIGGGLARRYAQEGASVLLGDLDGAAAKASAAEIEAEGGTIVGVQMDGAEPESIRAAVDQAVSSFGPLTGFHANFANFGDALVPVDVLEIAPEVYDEVMRVNARGFMLCTKHAVPELLKSGGGSIVYTSSGAAYLGQAGRVAYAMSKSAIHALMRHVATRFGPQGIRANCVTPGVTTHARFEQVMDPQVVEALRRGRPLGRLGTPADVSAMAALLMSDEGSYITGQVISVDGGGTMRP